MKNIEKYEKELKKYGVYFALTKEGKLVSCNGIFCASCSFYNCCSIKRMNWLLEEYKEPLLTDEGIKFLKEHIKQSGKTTLYIKIRKKVANYCEYRLEIHLDTGLISMPFAEKSKQYEMFKNMEIGVSYTPKELGL